MTKQSCRHCRWFLINIFFGSKIRDLKVKNGENYLRIGVFWDLDWVSLFLRFEFSYYFLLQIFGRFFHQKSSGDIFFFLLKSSFIYYYYFFLGRKLKSSFFLQFHHLGYWERITSHVCGFGVWLYALFSFVIFKCSNAGLWIDCTNFMSIKICLFDSLF